MTDHTNSELRQVLQKLCMMNNKFMNLMLDDNIDAAQIMLRVILKDDTIKVISVRIQDFIQNLFGHSAQLDILAKDSTGRLFNVEIQRSDEGARQSGPGSIAARLIHAFYAMALTTAACLIPTLFLLQKMMCCRITYPYITCSALLNKTIGHLQMAHILFMSTANAATTQPWVI